MNKQEIRAWIREKKKALTSHQIHHWSDAILESFYESELYKNADVIYVYVSYNEEVRTIPLIERALSDGKKVAVPKVISKQAHKMNFYYIYSMKDLKKGYQGILEPDVNEERLAKENGLMILPGLAFDLSGNRLGYGGGFYDCYLQENRKFTLVSFAFDFQVVPDLPCEQHDRTIDYLYTQTKQLLF